MKEDEYTGLCDWMLQSVLHWKDGLKFLPYTLWLIEKELRGGDAGVFYNEASEGFDEAA